MKRYTLEEWVSAVAGAFSVLLFVYYLFGPAGGSLMP
jgi:hypothetical protein